MAPGKQYASVEKTDLVALGRLGYKPPRVVTSFALLASHSGMKPMIAGRWMILTLLVSLMASGVAPAASPPSLNGGGVTIDLKSQLEKGLKARRPVEFAYIAQIVELVDSGKLPRSLVTSSYGWARQKPSRKLQYFQFALQARAKGLDVQLPDLRDQAVGISSNGGQR